MKRRKRCFTLMVVPHSEESTYSLRLPLAVGQFLTVLFVLGITAYMVVLFAYRGALEDAREASVLREVNRLQQDEINALAYETQQLLDQLEHIEDLAERASEAIGVNIAAEVQEGQVAVSRRGSGNRLYAGRSTSRSETQILDRTLDNINVLQQVIPERADSLDLLKEEIDEHLRRLASTPSIWPTRGRLTSGFGRRRSPFNLHVIEFHRGVDIANSFRTPIYATADGMVVFAGFRGGWGRLIIISHGYGFETHYAHLSGYAVSEGTSVTKGQVIGYMGNTGRSTGVHLHYEVHVNGVAVNPLNYM